jgi:hypothetical protein
LCVVVVCMSYPPRVHNGIASGVWGTERSCYDFIASQVSRDSRTLETGLGISTALFARLGTAHTCVVPSDVEAQKLVDYLKERGIEHAGVQFRIGFSDEILPAFETGPIDLFLIDGGHGFPGPVIDWFYGARHLQRGGTLVLDDLQLRAVRVLDDYLQADPRWVELARTGKWVAYRRDSVGPLREGEWMQPWFVTRTTLGKRAALLGRKVRWKLSHRRR